MIIAPASVPETFVPDPFAASQKGWTGEQGKAWAERNPRTVEELDRIYKDRYGITRSEMTKRFVGGLPKQSKILEVGCAAGTQLDVLRRLGFPHLGGCDICEAALEYCKYPHRVADVCDLPYADDSFDMVFTSGCLMHVPPFKRDKAASELKRVSRRFIWGFELWGERPQTFHFNALMPASWSEDWPTRFGMKELGKVVYRPVNANPMVMYLLEKLKENA